MHGADAATIDVFAGGKPMKFRPILMAVLAAATLGGCATYDYVGGSTPGGYYHGRSTVDYVGPYSGRYGYPSVGIGTGYGYLNYGYGYPSYYRYGYGYPYGQGHYHPPYRPPYRPPVSPPPTGQPQPPPSVDNGHRPPPWRNPTGQPRNPEQSAYWRERREQSEGNRGPAPWRNPAGQTRDPERTYRRQEGQPPRQYTGPRPTGEARPQPSQSSSPQVVPRPQAAPRSVPRSQPPANRREPLSHDVIEP